MQDFPVIFLILTIVGLLGLIVTQAIAPIIMRVASLTDVLSIIGEGLGEYFNRPGLGRGCCLITGLLALLLAAGCVALIVAFLGSFAGR